MREATADPRSEAAKILQEHPYFTAKVLKADRGPGGGETCDVGIFEHHSNAPERLIASYKRNYGFLETFWWFRRGRRHFALYSPDYTATRVMELFPGMGFKDIGGEEPSSGGFCPVEFYVPDCRKQVFEEFCGPGYAINDWNSPLAALPDGSEFTKDQNTHRARPKARGLDGQFLQSEHGWVWGEEGDYQSGWIKVPPDHGFMAGCVWGDDSSWKIQYLDLSRVEQGIIGREARFGYIVLPTSVHLRDAVYIYDPAGAPWVEIAVATKWDLQTGKMKPIRVAEWDE
jgi:hypothetical protein